MKLRSILATTAAAFTLAAVAPVAAHASPPPPTGGGGCSRGDVCFYDSRGNKIDIGWGGEGQWTLDTTRWVQAEGIFNYGTAGTYPNVEVTTYDWLHDWTFKRCIPRGYGVNFDRFAVLKIHWKKHCP